MKAPRQPPGFTLVELLVVIAVVAALAAILVPVTRAVRLSARASVSAGNLRQLAAATHSYIAENRGLFPPGMSFDNKTRWHGARASLSAPFDPTKGWLSPYLGREGRVKTCPQFALMPRVPDPVSFEAGAGAYGYNWSYLAGPPAKGTAEDPFKPEHFLRLPNPSRTVMFTTTAFVRSQGLQEYPFSEPPRSLNPAGRPETANLPSTHFRFGGKALVAWCDGRVSAEKPNPGAWPDQTYQKAAVGWFGPLEANGYWNPFYPNETR